MAGVAAIAVVLWRAHNDSRANRVNTHRGAAAIAASFTVKVCATLSPGCTIPVVEANLASIRAIAVIFWRAYSDRITGIAKSYAVTAEVARCFTINVGATLNPSSAIPGVDTYMTRVRTIAIIARRANG